MIAATLPNFMYFEPETLEQAIALLVKFRQDCTVLSGGTDLFVLMKKGVTKPKYVVNIAKLQDLNYIKHDDRGMRIGACTTIRTIEESRIIQERFPLLLEASSALGSSQIRNMATLASNLCRASPSGEMAPPLLVLDATVKLAGPECSRLVPVEKFFSGPGATALRPHELLVEVQIPNPLRHTGSAFLKAARTSFDLAKVNVAVLVSIVDNKCIDIKIALGAVAPTPVRARRAEELLKGKELREETISKAARMVSKEIKPIDDIRSTASYRKRVSSVLVMRAIKKSVERAERT